MTIPDPRPEGPPDGTPDRPPGGTLALDPEEVRALARAMTFRAARLGLLGEAPAPPPRPTE